MTTGKELRASSGHPFGGGRTDRGFEIENFGWAVDALLSAHFAHDQEPAGWENASPNSVVDRRRGDPKSICDATLPELFRDMSYACHGSHHPHLVDSIKSTTGGLSKNPQWVNTASMAEEPYAEIGSRLRALREGDAPKLSQKAWAEKNGFNPTQYNNWEKGSRRIPVDNAEKLCDLYGLTLDFVYRGRRDGLSEYARKIV